jgi:hypothetical protein
MLARRGNGQRATRLGGHQRIVTRAAPAFPSLRDLPRTYVGNQARWQCKSGLSIYRTQKSKSIKEWARVFAQNLNCEVKPASHRTDCKRRRGMQIC